MIKKIVTEYKTYNIVSRDINSVTFDVRLQENIGSSTITYLKELMITSDKACKSYQISGTNFEYNEKKEGSDAFDEYGHNIVKYEMYQNMAQQARYCVLLPPLPEDYLWTNASEKFSKDMLKSLTKNLKSLKVKLVFDSNPVGNISLTGIEISESI